GVIDRRPDDGRAFKCTFCYDRQKAGETPACAKACPTGSILFGDLEKLQEVADNRIAELHGRGMTDANLYDARGTSVGGIHAFFLIRGDARSYNLPLAPEAPTVYLRDAWTAAAKGAAALAGAVLIAFALGGRKRVLEKGRGTRGSSRNAEGHS
ncbi:MAG: 4Fe-4S dicluster domain-containing protein, partial [Acidobacteriota bacterium]